MNYEQIAEQRYPIKENYSFVYKLITTQFRAAFIEGMKAMEANGWVRKEDLVWEMIESWQDARDSTDERYLSEPRFSFLDIEADLYEYLPAPPSNHINPIQHENQK